MVGLVGGAVVLIPSVCWWIALSFELEAKGKKGKLSDTLGKAVLCSFAVFVVSATAFLVLVQL